MKIAVVALGKMGLPVAAWYASRGHDVTGCDPNPAIVEAVNPGVSHITHEPGLPEMVREAVTAGRLRATTDTAQGVAGADVVIVLVPLTVDQDHHPDYRALDTAFEAIGRGLSRGALVILETTVAVGDTRNRFLPMLERGTGGGGGSVHLAFSPERVQSGTMFRDLAAYPRVVGGVDDESARRAAAFYVENFGVEAKVLGSAEAAEFCKLAESVYRDVNIALANELALYAETRGVDVREVFPVANSQPQSHLHTPGVGVGGHCIPVYPYLLIDRREHSGLAALARLINDAMPSHAVEMLAQRLGGLAGRRVLILGVSFRAGVKEPAHSPALDLARELEQRGATVFAHDPAFSDTELELLGLYPMAIDPPPEVDAIIVQTADPRYRTVPFERFRGLRVILDGRWALDPVAVERAGIEYVAIGRGTGRAMAAEQRAAAP
ncbi:MAG: nucleotide sugar dehydrogenase [Chloroflexi bacterium]|nr:nucleotide sugar dehydrogenase [Chloroflexota bacterium]